MGNSTDYDGKFVPAVTANQQATNQLVALIVTLAIAMVGGSITGFIMRQIATFQRLDETYRHGGTVMKLALNVGNITGGGIGLPHLMPEAAFFDDDLFFEVNRVCVSNIARY